MLTAGGYGPPPRGAGPCSEFPPSPLLFRHGPVSCFPGATPAGSLPGVRDLEIKSEPAHMAPPGLSANDTTGMFFYFAATIYSLYIAVAGNNI